MVEKICSHCGTTVLVGLQYCPGCLRSLGDQGKSASQAVKVAVAPGADGTRVERLVSKWHDFAIWLSGNSTPKPLDKDDPRFNYNKGGTTETMSMSEGYTRVVCPKCLRALRAPLDQSPTDRIMCDNCLHQFPASLAAEFRRGADLNCYRCGVTSFCVSGLRVNHCPNCKSHSERAHDPEKAKIMAFFAAVAVVILAGFCHAVVTQTTGPFLMWLCIGTIFTAVGFVTMAALGF